AEPGFRGRLSAFGYLAAAKAPGRAPALVDAAGNGVFSAGAGYPGRPPAGAGQAALLRPWHAAGQALQPSAGAAVVQPRPGSAAAVAGIGRIGRLHTPVS